MRKTAKEVVKAHRQGEVLFIPISDAEFEHMTRNMPKIKNGVIREGEKSGHEHKVESGDLYGDQEKDMVMVASKGCAITHPEHKPVKLKKGQKYRVVIQREYNEVKDKKAKD